VFALLYVKVERFVGVGEGGGVLNESVLECECLKMVCMTLNTLMFLY
jgi:hypothetical protein